MTLPVGPRVDLIFLADAAARARDALAERDRTIRQLYAGGDVSLRAIGAAAGMSCEGVRKLVHRVDTDALPG